MRKLTIVTSALAFGSALLIAPHSISSPPPAACGLPAPILTFSGSFGPEMLGSYVFVPFDVPEGMTRVQLRICREVTSLESQDGFRHTLDLGVYGPLGDDGLWDTEEFRGWGGSSRPNVLITPEGDNLGTNGTTVGYRPGPIPAGKWAAEIGVAAIAQIQDGDDDGRVDWRLEVAWGYLASDLNDPWSPTPYLANPANSAAGWYKGDFHVHARHSNPGDATMQSVFDFAFGPGGAGLDFITLSDYVTDRHWNEIGLFQPDYPGKLIMRSAEIITYKGHINNHGGLQLQDYRTGPLYEWKGPVYPPVLLRPARPASDVLASVGGAGGITQINHPTTFPSKVPAFAKLCRGCSWEYSDQETAWELVDAMEVNTGPAGTHEPKGNELGPNPFSALAIEWWDRLWREGYRITAVGSSDSHRANQEAFAQYSPIGEATTVVYATQLSEQGVKDAIEAGHAYVKFFSASGPDLRFEAQPSSGGPSVIMGDEITSPSIDFTAKVLGAAPSPQPRTLHVFRDGVSILAVPVTSNDLTFSWTTSLPGIYRLQLQRGTTIEALTNPILFTST